jgi:hypothetical protein
MVPAPSRILYSGSVRCGERERLASIYHAAVSRNNEVASVMATAFREGWLREWQHEMRAINAACQAVLKDFDQHVSERGC